MSKYAKLIMKILTGTADADITFSELCQLLIRLGFTERIKGSHHLFTRENIEEIINLQARNSKAKPYQVKQVRILLTKYRMGENNID
ncbi:type II toxin-antitoxin system HicA family toxin [Nitrosomonas sp. JL21]|uniref:type II toxin-antitoxin system HicA family toxin n=1 Tax=Nitrosomonas sp. JL21 TaxID=153949 RepID=UPI00136FD835|nr:type II toxin-antitoxin system HicA family toxin [Nitrosomonas sp. JL21]MBL8498491.1 type II toxin-antitoxin system HicA family toxin [Nitrosomonas sp.]MCC7092161.1 type II toxin-antitoxin system HicA family toxin [Nitrosomonas sp.]MXS76848.1 type II toxin-antitoxin system HicA family toxin [Nitrosomonas sp. JL21]